MSADELTVPSHDRHELVLELLRILAQSDRTPAATIEDILPYREGSAVVRDPFELAYVSRRIRDDAIREPSLFGEAPWDVLLTLASAADPLTLTALCEASRVTPSAAVRYVSEMERRGMIHRRSLGPHRLGIGLTNKTRRRMDEYAERMRPLAMRMSND
ncbi:MAG: MarR family transcriptional regulator [Nitrospira sp.]|nr:MarR family transcriptional regulator [Nitrospira sp.]